MHPRFRAPLLAGLLTLVIAAFCRGNAHATCTEDCLAQYVNCLYQAFGDADTEEYCRNQLLLCLAGCPAAPACVTPAECLWPVGCTLAQWPDAIYLSYDPYTFMRGMILNPLPDCTTVPASGPFTVDSFFDVFFDLSFDFGTTWQQYHANGHGVVNAKPSLIAEPGVRWFETEMVQLDITGGSLPSGMQLRETPGVGRESKGVIRDLPGPTAGLNSFFDVYFDLSTDGGQTWTSTGTLVKLSLGTELPVPVRAPTWGAVKLRYR